jgi:hypothetical protein
VTDQNWHVEHHIGNPAKCRVVGPKFRQMDECEGGGWYTDEATAHKIAAAPQMIEALEQVAILGHGKCTIGKPLAAMIFAALSKAKA